MSISDEYGQPPLPGMERPPTVELDAHGYELAKRLNQARNAIKGWREVEDECREALKKILTGDEATEGTFSGMRNGQVVVRAQCTKTHRFDSTAFKSDHLPLYEQYLRESYVTTVKPA